MSREGKSSSPLTFEYIYIYISQQEVWSKWCTWRMETFQRCRHIPMGNESMGNRLLKQNIISTHSEFLIWFSFFEILGTCDVCFSHAWNLTWSAGVCVWLVPGWLFIDSSRCGKRKSNGLVKQEKRPGFKKVGRSRLVEIPVPLGHEIKICAQGCTQCSKLCSTYQLHCFKSASCVRKWGWAVHWVRLDHCWLSLRTQAQLCTLP